jgi:integrase
MEAIFAEQFAKQEVLTKVNPVKFQSLIEAYLEHIKSILKPTSLMTRKYTIKKYIIPYFDKTYLEDITIDFVNEWKKKLLASTETFTTLYVNRIIKLLKAMLEYGNLYYDLNYNVYRKIDIYKDNTIVKEATVWTIKEFNQFISVVPESSIYGKAYKTLFFTGLRIGELQALQISDFNKEKRTINVNKTLTNKSGDGSVLFLPPKTANAYRYILLDDYTYQVVLSAVGERKEGYLFEANGKHLSGTTITRKKNEYCKKANIVPIRLHDFRHSHITMLQELGVNVAAIGKRVGHSRESMSFHYIHSNVSQQINIVNILDILNEKKEWYEPKKLKARKTTKKQGI